jgi:hypothetical protein
MNLSERQSVRQFANVIPDLASNRFVVDVVLAIKPYRNLQDLPGKLVRPVGSQRKDNRGPVSRRIVFHGHRHLMVIRHHEFTYIQCIAKILSNREVFSGRAQTWHRNMYVDFIGFSKRGSQLILGKFIPYANKRDIHIVECNGLPGASQEIALTALACSYSPRHLPVLRALQKSLSIPAAHALRVGSECSATLQRSFPDCHARTARQSHRPLCTSKPGEGHDSRTLSRQPRSSPLVASPLPVTERLRQRMGDRTAMDVLGGADHRSLRMRCGPNVYPRKSNRSALACRMLVFASFRVNPIRLMASGMRPSPHC